MYHRDPYLARLCFYSTLMTLCLTLDNVAVPLLVRVYRCHYVNMSKKYGATGNPNLANFVYDLIESVAICRDRICLLRKGADSLGNHLDGQGAAASTGQV